MFISRYGETNYHGEREAGGGGNQGQRLLLLSRDSKASIHLCKRRGPRLLACRYLQRLRPADLRVEEVIRSQYRLIVRTPPFHGDNAGSNPATGTTERDWLQSLVGKAVESYMGRPHLVTRDERYAGKGIRQLVTVLRFKASRCAPTRQAL